MKGIVNLINISLYAYEFSMQKLYVRFPMMLVSGLKFILNCDNSKNSEWFLNMVITMMFTIIVIDHSHGSVSIETSKSEQKPLLRELEDTASSIISLQVFFVSLCDICK